MSFSGLPFFCPRREGRWNILYFYYGPSLYYVSIFIEFFRPTHYVSMNRGLNVSNFRNQLAQSFCWRNVGMIPYYYSWSLKLETKELHFPTVYSSTHMAKVNEKIEYWGIVYWLIYSQFFFSEQNSSNKSSFKDGSLLVQVSSHYTINQILQTSTLCYERKCSCL